MLSFDAAELVVNHLTAVISDTETDPCLASLACICENVLELAEEGVFSSSMNFEASVADLGSRRVSHGDVTALVSWM